MHCQKGPGQRGASLLEVIIVLAIGSLLFTVAASQFGRSNKILDRQNVAREFKVALERARFDAVKRRPTTLAEQSKVTVVSATSFSYTYDMNQNGRLDLPGETIVVDFGVRKGGITLAGTNFVYPVTVYFDARGEITVENGTSSPTISPIFYFCNGTCTAATATNDISDKIYVSPTGTVIMLGGGDVLPGFANPSVTPIPANSSVNPYTSVWTDGAGTPLPTPTASPASSSTPTSTATATATATSTATNTSTPTRTPTATPTVAASPMSTPTFTATPTPTPRNCVFGEKPAQTGCVCNAPMFVRSNGMCK